MATAPSPPQELAPNVHAQRPAHHDRRDPAQSRHPSQAPSDMSQRQGEGVQQGAGRSVATVERQRRDPARRAGPSSCRRCPARHAAPRRCRASGATVRPSRAGRARRGRDRESRCHYETPPDCAARTNRMQHPAYVCYHEPRHKNGEHPRQRVARQIPTMLQHRGVYMNHHRPSRPLHPVGMWRPFSVSQRSHTTTAPRVTRRGIARKSGGQEPRQAYYGADGRAARPVLHK